MNIGIIGCGLIGHKRAISIHAGDHLVACCDSNKDVLNAFIEKFNCNGFENYKELIDNCDVNVVVVAVVNKYALSIISYALSKKKHVLAEKPLGRNTKEAKEMVALAKYHNLILKTGFNHRFHPTVWQAKEMLDQGKIGKLMTIRARYGHGGRPGMEKEWRASKDLCGGGELLDQGVHIIDLCHWFAGEIKTVFGKIATKFWNIEVEDNAFALMESVSGVDIQFHVSWTNWKNIFSFELFGEDGYLRIEGLGGSYGPETLEFGLRKKEGGKPEIQFFDYPAEDFSWKNEWLEFKDAISNKREAIGSGDDGLYANRIIEAIYKSSGSKKLCKI
jgi:predicted dehydrogenase